MKKLSDQWETRFWSKVDKTDYCWNWISPFTRGGYGKFSITIGIKKYIQLRAHRVSYYLFYGVFDTTLCVLHKCDNRKCVNPNHLFLGSRKDNWDDAKSKNRVSIGSKHPISILTEREAALIKYCDVSSWAELAKMFGVHKFTIQNIKWGKTWRHV